jgi:hypothetical protein
LSPTNADTSKNEAAPDPQAMGHKFCLPSLSHHSNPTRKQTNKQTNKTQQSKAKQKAAAAAKTRRAIAHLTFYGPISGPLVSIFSHNYVNLQLIRGTKHVEPY